MSRLALFSRTICSAALLVLFGAVSAGAQGSQGAAPDPTAQSQAGQPQSPRSSYPGPQPTFQAEARTVLVDVVVTDAHDRPVQGLPVTTFRVFEDGAPQQITFFEEHHGVTQPARPLPPLPPNVYSNIPPSPVTDSVNVILLDALNTPFKDQPYVRAQMIKYLKTIPPGTRIAIFTLASRLRFVQGFTSDPAVLLAALKSKKSLPASSPLLNEFGESAVPQADAFASPAPGAMEGLQQFEADVESFQLDMRVRITLDAFQQLGRYLSGVPGRKNILWFSGAFPLSVDPDSTLSSPFSVLRNFSDQIRETGSILSVGQIAVYPVDARGLMVSPMFDASQSGAAFARNPSAFAKADMKFLQQTAQEHLTMQSVAESTGGQAIFNTNGLKEAVARVIDMGSHYYSLAYTPANKKQDGRFRKLQIKLEEQGYKLSYRRGYYAVASNDPRTVVKTPETNPFSGSMQRGAPNATQILFKVRVLPIDPQPDTNLPASRNGDNGAHLKGPVVRYAIDYAADLRAMQLRSTPDGLKHGALQISAVAYDEDGKPLNSIINSLRLTLNPSTYDRFLRQGFQYHQELDLPKGEAFLHLGILDMANSNMGTVEVPLLIKPEPQSKASAAAH